MKDTFDFLGKGDMPKASEVCGGVKEAKPLPYSPPVGPSNINDPKSPGIHGTNHGNAGTQGRR